jgi:hypothetical protein
LRLAVVLAAFLAVLPAVFAEAALRRAFAALRVFARALAIVPPLRLSKP